jgi:hypothetical protein
VGGSLSVVPTQRSLLHNSKWFWSDPKPDYFTTILIECQGEFLTPAFFSVLYLDLNIHAGG